MWVILRKLVIVIINHTDLKLKKHVNVKIQSFQHKFKDTLFRKSNQKFFNFSHILKLKHNKSRWVKKKHIFASSRSRRKTFWYSRHFSRLADKKSIRAVEQLRSASSNHGAVLPCMTAAWLRRWLPRLDVIVDDLASLRPRVGGLRKLAAVGANCRVGLGKPPPLLEGTEPASEAGLEEVLLVDGDWPSLVSPWKRVWFVIMWYND